MIRFLFPTTNTCQAYSGVVFCKKIGAIFTYLALCTVHTYTNFNTIDYNFLDLENLNNIFINFVVNRT